jgi:acyl carrier protein
VATADAKANEEAKKKIVNFVVDQMRQGVPRTSIVSRLTETGIDHLHAVEIVDAVEKQVERGQEEEEVTATSIGVAIASGAVAAIIGGIIWGLIVIATDYEIGYMATGIGLLTGFAVVFFSGKKGLILQIIAVVSALVGIVVGKYITFYAILKDYVASEYGQAAAQQVSILSSELIDFFFESIGDLASPYDILWIILAIVAAWRIPRGLGIPRKNTAI